jgi:hypothetical protein
LSLFFFAAQAFFPGFLGKVMEWGNKPAWVLASLHAVVFLLLGLGYTETVPLGSAGFFEQLRVAGVFWIGLFCLSRFVISLLHESSVAALSDLELEVAADRLESHESILGRYKEAYVSKRLSLWLAGTSRRIAAQAHDIASHTHESVQLINSRKPSEFDLRKVEDAYKHADAVYRRMEKENQRFHGYQALLDLGEAEREKIEEVRDLFSRELRNAKLELASVRKRIDEKLVSLKTAAPGPAEVPVEKVPV